MSKLNFKFFVKILYSKNPHLGFQNLLTNGKFPGITAETVRLKNARNRNRLLTILIKYQIDINEIVNGTLPLEILLNLQPPGYEKTAVLLLKSGAQVTTTEGESLLARYFHFEISKKVWNLKANDVIQAMLKVSADPNVKWRDEHEPLAPILQVAWKLRDAEGPIQFEAMAKVFFMLLAHGADISFNEHEYIKSRSNILYALITSYHIGTKDLTDEMIRAVIMRKDISSKMARDIIFELLIKNRESLWLIQNTFKLLIERVDDVNVSVNGDTILEVLCAAYFKQPRITHSMIHETLKRGAFPTYNLLNLLERKKIYFFVDEIFIKTVNLFLNYGANPYLTNNWGYMFWHYVSKDIIPCCEIIHKIRIDKNTHRLVLLELKRMYHPWMYHPDRLRVRMQSIQTRLDEQRYQDWITNDNGWLEYLGIYNLESFQEKMLEYVRFLD